jgi:hypothetical protein
MKKILIIFEIALSAILLIATDYRAKTIKVLPIESYPARISVQDITIAADPYSDDEKSFLAFDVKHLNSQGYFPIHVIVQNNTPDFLIVRTRNILLIAADGQKLYSTPISVLVEDIFKASSINKISRDPSGAIKAGSPLSDFSGKDLTNKLIDPGKVSDGFLFFFNADPKKNLFAGSTLLIPKLEEEGTKKSFGPFSIPLDPALISSKK